MHPDNKLTSHGKQVNSGAQTLIPNVNQQQQQQQQGPAGSLGSKGVGAGNHGAKANQISPGNSGLKSAGQLSGGSGELPKSKAKRERSMSMDPGDQRDSLTPVLDPDAKEGVMRSKRRCVLVKKQPYSGDEWCSGPDTEEEEDKPPTAPHRELSAAGPAQSLTGPSPMGPISESGCPALGRGMGPGIPPELSRPGQQVVYVFTTSLANSAAEAVLHGHSDSILLFHQQNVPRTKLDKCAPAVKLPSLSEQLNSCNTPSTSTPKSQSGTPRPASVGAGAGGNLHPAGTPTSAVNCEEESPQARPGAASGNYSSTASHQPSAGGPINPSTGAPRSGDAEGSGLLPHAGSGVSPSPSPGAASALLQRDQGQMGAPGSSDRLSKEQLEHRERSLQTLRDIERLLLRSGGGAGPGEPPGTNGNPGSIGANNNIGMNSSDATPGGPNSGPGLESNDSSTNATNSNNSGIPPGALPPLGALRKYEEPLQSIISQTQNLEGPGLDDPHIGPHHGLPALHNPSHPLHHHMPSPSGLDMGPHLGSDGLTPEQMAWRKLQDEYYQEKRRQQEMHPHPHHYRMMPEMAMGGPMMRGPPPPYHSKPGEQQWTSGPMMGLGMGAGGNGRLMEMHQEGPRGQRFLGQMHRAPPGSGGGGGYSSNPGGILPMEAMGHQRHPRPGMGWLEDMPPNAGGGAPFQGCYAPSGPGGPPQHLQGNPERFFTREDMFRMLEKRQLQGLHRLELDRMAKQQQQQQQQQPPPQGGLGVPRLMDNMGAGGFPGPGMGGGPPSRGDPIDFPSSRAMLGSPLGGAGVGGAGGPPLRDLVDSPMGNMSISMNMNPQMQQTLLAQKLRAGSGGPGSLGEMPSSEEMSRVRAAQNGRGTASGLQTNKNMTPGGGPLQFPGGQAPFPGGQGSGGFMQPEPAPDIFAPDHQGPGQMGGTPRLSHMPLNSGPRGSDLSQRHSSDLAISINPVGSPAMPLSQQLKSPSLSQEASPLMPSPSAPGLKSPTQMPSTGPQPPPPPATTGSGTPSSSMKSPQVMGPSSLGLRSPSGSPGRLKSPAMPVASPVWAASPKTAMPSPGGPPSGKGTGNGGSSSTETGPSLPPRSTNSTPVSQPGSINPSMPFTSSPDAQPSQNPLSLIMSQMSKYAMPSSTPLYHDAIKTIATSDDEMLPDRPLLPSVNMTGNMGNHQTSQMLLTSQSSVGPHSGPQSPMGMVLQGQPPLSHDTSGPMLHSPSPMGMPNMNPAMMGGPPDGMEPCNVSPMLPQNLMGGFSRMQPPPHGGMHSPSSGMAQPYPQPPDDMLPHHQLHLLSKGLPHQRASHPPDSFHPMSAGDSPDLSDVIRPTPTGIPEFDLSRIIPADKPSSTLQYFPKSETLPHPQQNPLQGGGSQQPPPPQHLKQHPPSGPPSSNPHIASLQNMMAEQQLAPPHSAHSSMRAGLGLPPGGARGLPPGGAMGPICHPGHGMGRTAMMHQQQQQAMMGNNVLHHPSHPHPTMMSPQQHQQNMMAQQNMMMMQAKQRSMSVPGDPYGQQGLLMSPQGPMMGPPHPQSGMMGPQALRQRGMSLDSPLGYGHGAMANMPF
ncbi:B-cell CLL/lymphoma 9-like protein isoform X2 [Scleropages formosus]|uniref:Bcl9 like n=1 Tax=Scleropages formosus TaxID=113540 RepID=A0A8C9SMN4_SCLFO|nr:B-cell CLL/lymphoma 9-like protein isoform X2 [Scleropages formosus]